MPILILEGIDKSGKTTVLTDLKEVYPHSIVFKLSNKPESSSLVDRLRVQIAYSELFSQALRLSDEGSFVIFDRAYPSELVYSVRRGYDAMTNEFWKELDKTLKRSVLLIYCEAPRSRLEKRFEETEETDLELSELSLVLDRYKQFLKKTKLPILKLNTTNTVGRNRQKILDFIKEHEHRRDQN